MLATAVAAKEDYTLPAIIVDMGTATTVTVVDARGIYIGGAILPGPGTALRGLVSHTALLPSIDFTAPDRAIAKDTTNAMKSGIIYGSAGAIDGIVDRYEEELRAAGESAQPLILATGGMGGIIAPFCRHEITVDAQLRLKGLGIIWKRNHR
jgi:type III pantothenate kinase